MYDVDHGLKLKMDESPFLFLTVFLEIFSRESSLYSFTVQIVVERTVP